jgi:hypothetical protein
VILAVLDATFVFNVLIDVVLEVMLEVLDVTFVFKVLIDAVLEVMLEVLDVTFVFKVLIDAVLEVMLEVLDATFVFKVLIDAVLEVILAVLDVIVFVAEVILVSKVAMVDELTPPTVFTVGTLAVPLKSPDKSIIPFVEVVASVGVYATVQVNVPLPVVVNTSPLFPCVFG